MHNGQILPSLVPPHKITSLLIDSHQLLLELKSHVLTIDIIQSHSKEYIIKSIAWKQVPKLMQSQTVRSIDHLFSFIAKNNQFLAILIDTLQITIKRDYGFDILVFKAIRRTVTQEQFLERKLKYMQNWVQKKKLFYSIQADRIEYRIAGIIKTIAKLTVKYNNRLRGTRSTIKRISKYSKNIMKYAAFLQKFDTTQQMFKMPTSNSQ